MSYIKTSKPLKISRAGLQLFKECPRCFWLYKHKDIRRPQGYPYTLSIAVDQLLKEEFDQYRERGEMHPALAGYKGLEEAKLFSDQAQLREWRNNFEGLKYHDKDLDATLFGAVDDMLEFPDGSLAVVDYKSSGAKEIMVYDDYKMQMDVYTYLLEQMGYKTSRKGYFVFYQVEKNDGFKGRLPFRGEVREVDADPNYVRDLFAQAVALARADKPPKSHTDCKYCIWAGHHKELEPGF
jgi:hypothetical protein